MTLISSAAANISAAGGRAPGVGDTRERVTRWRAGFQHHMLALGAIPIDASAPCPS
ncbi:MAG: hypothetical protein ABIZ05_10840 [Pseudonocardiaceae bacterium]